MAFPLTPSTFHASSCEAVPPLENGDTLTRAEFERRYEAMPHLKKAELIEGVVYVPSPVRHRFHGRQHTHLTSWLGHYEAGTPGVEASDNSTYGWIWTMSRSQTGYCSSILPVAATPS